MPEISVNAMKVFLSIVMSCHQPCSWRKLPCCARASPARQRGCNSPLQWILPIFSQAQSISDWNWRAVLANQPNFPSRSILSPLLHVRCGGHTVLMFFAVEELQKLWPTAKSLWLWFCAALSVLCIALILFDLAILKGTGRPQTQKWPVGPLQVPQDGIVPRPFSTEHSCRVVDWTDPRISSRSLVPAIAFRKMLGVYKLNFSVKTDGLVLFNMI